MAETVRGESFEQDNSRFVMIPNFAIPRHTFAEKRSIELESSVDRL
ncbi:MAG: hypothetical protein GY829_07815 [Gammaproteobacteria bacterium]|nr:hypothetical protein [Gammaproteobacteria bacterium]